MEDAVVFCWTNTGMRTARHLVRVREINSFKIFVKSLKKRDHLEILRADGRIQL
jgi:hypothetical protein